MRWSLTCACFLGMLVFFGSFWRAAFIQGQGYNLIEIEAGHIVAALDNVHGLSLRPRHLGFFPADLRWYWWFHHSRLDRFSIISIPLWLFLAPLLLATVWSWWRRAASLNIKNVNQCPACLYDCGTPSGVCPECGKPRSAATRL